MLSRRTILDGLASRTSINGMIFAAVFVGVVIATAPLSGAALRFMPHRFCLRGNSSLIASLTMADATIGTSYMVISFILFRVNVTRQSWVIRAFLAFILLCGLTHFSDVLTMWFPAYYIDAGVRSLCALVSLVTACSLPAYLRSKGEKLVDLL